LGLAIKAEVAEDDSVFFCGLRLKLPSGQKVYQLQCEWMR